MQEFQLDATAVTNAQFRRFRKASAARCCKGASACTQRPRPLLLQESSYRTDAEKFGWSFVLELHASATAKAASNATVKEAPHWLVVQGAWWRAPQVRILRAEHAGGRTKYDIGPHQLNIGKPPTARRPV